MLESIGGRLWDASLLQASWLAEHRRRIEWNSSVLCGLRFSLSDLESKIQGTSVPMKTPRSYLYSHNLMGSKPCLEVVTIISNSPLGCGRITYRDSAKPFSQQDLCLLLQDITVMVLSFQT